VAAARRELSQRGMGAAFFSERRGALHLASPASPAPQAPRAGRARGGSEPGQCHNDTVLTVSMPQRPGPAPGAAPARL